MKIYVVVGYVGNHNTINKRGLNIGDIGILKDMKVPQYTPSIINGGVYNVFDYHKKNYKYIPFMKVNVLLKEYKKRVRKKKKPKNKRRGK